MYHFLIFFKCPYDNLTYSPLHDVNKLQLNPLPLWWICELLPVLCFRNRVAFTFSVYILCKWVSFSCLYINLQENCWIHQIGFNFVRQLQSCSPPWLYQLTLSSFAGSFFITSFPVFDIEWYFNTLEDLLWEVISFNMHFTSYLLYLLLLPVDFPESCLFHFFACFSLRCSLF